MFLTSFCTPRPWCCWPFACGATHKPAARTKTDGHMTTQPCLDPCRCPLCGQANACAMTLPDAQQHGACWCTRMHFSAALLQRVPPAARNKACICQRCAGAPTAQIGD
ncbi:cysteine-rich CWC family protein [Limnohabitans sp.]|uniref:cysteine-rich CWC family protein n=1 Tax=Limnohabitans sp. TaxID=1907725 RepID=UPI0037BE5795